MSKPARLPGWALAPRAAPKTRATWCERCHRAVSRPAGTTRCPHCGYEIFRQGKHRVMVADPPRGARDE